MLEIVELAQRGFGPRQPGSAAQVVEHKMVGAFGVEGEKQGFDEGLIHRQPGWLVPRLLLAR